MRQVAHVLLTRPPLALFRRTPLARLACVRHAASVRPEPGSNSQFKKFELCSNCFADLLKSFIDRLSLSKLTGFTFISLFNFQRPILFLRRFLSTTFIILSEAFASVNNFSSFFLISLKLVLVVCRFSSLHFAATSHIIS